ncbi:GPI inositol-deacylase [Anthophora retusa]
MIRSKSVIFYTILFLFLILFLLFYILGIARYVTDFEENTCDMTYMFEYPQYVRISLDNEIEERYPRYGLYAYGEGFITEKLRRMYFSGIPVLFIPGNVGSHQQVRSLASVSLRKGLKDRTPFHFDYFTVSLNKDYSALYGGVLMEETEYVSYCIQKILNLYKTNIKKVVLIGHSMGGVIAKGAILLTPNVNTSVANIIITLATPHTPTLVLDSAVATYYRNLENHLHEIKDAGISVVSIGGGPRDTLITSTQIVDSAADINVISNTIPDVWKSTDHLSILWCKQLVLCIVRSLFDSVDYNQKPPNIFSKTEERMQALSYHFYHHASGKRLYLYKETIQFESGGEWIENIQRNYVWTNKNLSRRTSSVYLMIRLSGQSNYHLTIDTVNIESKDWLFACTASSIQGQSRVCNWGWNLTNRTRILPDPLHRIRKTVDLNLQEIKYPGVTHVIVRITPDDLEKYIAVNVDLYSYDARFIPIWGSSPLLKSLFVKPQPKLSNLGHIRYYATFDNIMDVITVELKASECTDPKHHAIVELLEPWSIGVTQIQFFTLVDDGPKTMKIQTKYKYSNISQNLRITLDPACSYAINIQQGGIIDRISCIVRDRWYLLYTTIISLLLLSLSVRINHGLEQTPIIVITVFLSFCYDLMFECLVALAILCVFTIGLCCCVIFLGSVAHSIAVRFLARAITFSTTWSDWLLGGLNQLPFIVTILVLSLIPATCGALAMLISVFLYFLNLTKMYEDYLEKLLMASLQHFNWGGRFRNMNNSEEYGNTRQKIFNHLILFILWCFIAIAAVPSVLVWARNFSYDMRLSTEDPLLLQSWIVLVTCSTMEWVQFPSNNHNTRSQILSSILCFLGWVILLMGAAPHPPFYQYYMPPLIAGAVAIISLNFIFS